MNYQNVGDCVHHPLRFECVLVLGSIDAHVSIYKIKKELEKPWSVTAIEFDISKVQLKSPVYALQTDSFLLSLDFVRMNSLERLLWYHRLSIRCSTLSSTCSIVITIFV